MAQIPLVHEVGYNPSATQHDQYKGNGMMGKQQLQDSHSTDASKQQGTINIEVPLSVPARTVEVPEENL